MFFGLMDTATGGAGDEFYDASEDMDNRIETVAKETGTDNEDEEKTPRGRKEHHQNMFLLERPDIPLYDFHTQNPKPHTENEIKEFELKCSEETDEHEQFGQYFAPLRSDMQAFKVHTSIRVPNFF